MSCTEFIYNITQNKLVTIRDYLINALKKIRLLNSLTKAFVLFVKKIDDSLRLYVNYCNLSEIIIKK